ncbi:FkbM family methyltransferase [Methylocapsa acidiphila]|uniref:FkbM family methyltransferase n=1 Tax=Methylocapsa acidiphila TaxID=133552 RepID=UPI000479E880|nr:FkbM family methyltransferase [Methylocapsa acidiphila]
MKREYTVHMPDRPPIASEVMTSKSSALFGKFCDVAAGKIAALIKNVRPAILSVSQCGQDVFVIDKVFHRKRDGFFLEIGGGDGKYLSNTLILEADFRWRGILAEPTGAFEAMVRNRPHAICDRVAIAGTRKTVRLFEIMDKGQALLNPDVAGANTLLSVIDEAKAEQPSDGIPDWATITNSYLVETITLDDLLTKHNAPPIVDYFSLDVEGSEYDILENFPFNKWRFNCINVERPSMELNKLLLDNEYILLKRDVLDWFYLHRDFLIERLEI